MLKGEKEFNTLKNPNDLPKNCHAHKIKPYFPDDPTAVFAFAPVFTGQINVNNTKISFEGNCFEETSLELVYDEQNPSEYKVIATLGKKRSFTCGDSYLFGNTETLHFEEFLLPGTHTMKFKASGQDAIDNIRTFGL